MIERVTHGAIRRLYRATGPRYRWVVHAGEGWSSVVVAVIAVSIIATFYDPPLREVLLVVGVGAGMTTLAVTYAAVRAGPAAATIERWRATAMPTPQETVAAWHEATTFTLRQYRRDSLTVSALASLPTSAVAAWRWELGVGGLFAMLLACVIPALYATVLSYSIGEILVQPLVEDIAAQLPDDFPFEARGLPVATRLQVALPAYTTGTGVTVAGLIGDGSGSAELALAVVVSLGVGLLLSRELTVLLASSITGPIAAVREQLARVQAGDYDARLPVLSSDELGELTHDFNLMALGLAEREELRSAFGTYLDRDVAQLILSGQFPQEGVEVDVSLLFCDVRGFTSYAETVTATELIATLNRLFTEIVPVVEAYGGHVDKFMGDGLLAVFGAPEVMPDHADRAVAAARMLVDAVHLGDTGFRIAAGVNSGRVAAGPIGGAGRLNFSVIGDAVNVAARAESATRETGDDVLITAATRDRLTRPLDLVPRGAIPLKGKAEPVELFALAAAPSPLTIDHFQSLPSF